MIKVIRATWGAGASPIWELTCSAQSDVSKLPTTISNEEPFKSKGVGVGSTCICTENHSEYMLGADDKWHKIKTYAMEVDKPKVTLHNCSHDTIVEAGDDPGNYVQYSLNGGASWYSVDETVTIETDRLLLTVNSGNARIGGHEYCPDCNDNGEYESFPLEEDVTITEDMVIHCYSSY